MRVKLSEDVFAIVVQAMQFGMLANEDVSSKILAVDFVLHDTEDGVLVVPDKESVDMLNKFFSDPELQKRIQDNVEALRREGVIVVDDEDQAGESSIILDRTGLN